MATPYTDAYVRYDGNGVTTEFSIDFDYKEESDVKVYLKRGTAEQVTVPSTDYSFVTKNTLKFPASGSSETVLAVGDVLAIQRESEFSSEYVFDNQRRLEPVEVMNSDDNLERQIQELKRDVGQAIRIQPTSNINTDEYFIAVESVYENIDNIKTVSGISSDIITCSDNIDAIKDAPNQATAAAQSAIEAEQSATESAQSAIEAEQSATESAQSASDAGNSKANAFDSASRAQSSAIACADYEIQAKRWAIGDISDRPEGSAKYWAEYAAFGNIGDIKYTTRTDVPNGGAWCDGAEYTKAQFPDVYQMLVEGKIGSTDFSTFDSTVSANGSCGLFALDTDTTSFKVPLLKDVYVKAGDAPLMFGGESLPNIKGTVKGTNRTDTGETTNGFKDFTGSFYNTGDLTSNVCETAAGQFKTNGLGFSASRSSSTYQDGAKVNPDHVVYRAYVVLYSSVAEASEAQAAEFITALGNKANLDLSNVNSVGTTFIAHNAMPSDRYIDLELGASGATYTAPADGIISISGKGSWVDVVVVTTGRGSCSEGRSSDGFSRHEVSVKKDDAFLIYYGSGFVKVSFRFVYTEGSK